MNIFKRLKYQIDHRNKVIEIYSSCFGTNVPWRILLHDFDKIPLILLTPFSRKFIKKIHKRIMRHHIVALNKCYHKLTPIQRNNYVCEMVCDWEASRFTKPNKPMTAREYFDESITINPWLNEDLVYRIKTVIQTIKNNQNKWYD